MPKSVNQKQKLLFLLDYLRQNTDETHTVTTPQIIDHLAANGIRAERKSIYNDIQTLCDYGYDIIRTEGAHAGYRIADRTFELPEVKLLVDLVQSSKFITTKKSRQLIGKLEQLVSKNDAKKLQRQVVVADRNKTSNEKNLLQRGCHPLCHCRKPADPFPLLRLECQKRNAAAQKRQILSGQPLASYLG